MNGSRKIPDFTLRPTVEELEELRRLAKATGKSLNRYLIERGLSTEEPICDAHPSEYELKERAVFELRRAGHNLRRIAERVTGESGNVSRPQIEEAIREMVAAARMLGATFEEERGG